MGVSLYVCDGVVTVLTFCLRCWLELSRLFCVTCFCFSSGYSPHLALQPRFFFKCGYRSSFVHGCIWDAHLGSGAGV